MICFFSVLLYLKQHCRDDYREFGLFGGFEFDNQILITIAPTGKLSLFK
jgi:hypothetical protein